FERDLSADIFILADRYAFAEMLYQAKVSFSEWCRPPEISILAHNPLIISHLIKLWNDGEEKYEKGKMQRKVREIFNVWCRSRRFGAK
ncbi:hypothetical protein JOM56_010979, partial [Amanita muscaria]